MKYFVKSVHLAWTFIQSDAGRAILITIAQQVAKALWGAR